MERPSYSTCLLDGPAQIEPVSRLAIMGYWKVPSVKSLLRCARGFRLWQIRRLLSAGIETRLFPVANSGNLAADLAASAAAV